MAKKHQQHEAHESIGEKFAERKDTGGPIPTRMNNSERVNDFIHCGITKKK
jgi:hypothetical protein